MFYIGGLILLLLVLLTLKGYFKRLLGACFEDRAEKDPEPELTPEEKRARQREQQREYSRRYRARRKEYLEELEKESVSNKEGKEL